MHSTNYNSYPCFVHIITFPSRIYLINMHLMQYYNHSSIHSYVFQLCDISDEIDSKCNVYPSTYHDYVCNVNRHITQPCSICTTLCSNAIYHLPMPCVKLTCNAKFLMHSFPHVFLMQQSPGIQCHAYFIYCSRAIQPWSNPCKMPSLTCQPDRKSTRLNSSHSGESRMPSSA